MTQLIWAGKYVDGKKTDPVRVALPFQDIETVNESAQSRARQLGPLRRGPTVVDGVSRHPDYQPYRRITGASVRLRCYGEAFEALGDAVGELVLCRPARPPGAEPPG